MEYKKLWIGFTLVVVISFAVLIYFGVEIYREVPHIPEQVTPTEGEVLFSGQDVKEGQNVWQSIGGQEVGSIDLSDTDYPQVQKEKEPSIS